MMRKVIALLAAVFAVVAFAVASDRPTPRVAMPAIEIEKSGFCVAPTDEMRRNHMKMLLHQRDLTVHQGLREPRFSLKNCVDCHASRKTGSVLGKNGFCAGCHSYASVRIDCFECHSPLRQDAVAAR
jgi:hypothetical protein